MTFDLLARGVKPCSRHSVITRQDSNHFAFKNIAETAVGSHVVESSEM